MTEVDLELCFVCGWKYFYMMAEMISMASAALMYVLVPMPCLFFGGGSTHFLTSRDGGG